MPGDAFAEVYEGCPAAAGATSGRSVLSFAVQLFIIAPHPERRRETKRAAAAADSAATLAAGATGSATNAIPDAREALMGPAVALVVL